MRGKNHKVVLDPVYGFKRLDPIPQNKEIEEFYQSKYYDLIRKGGRAQELSRLLAGEEEAEKERSWLQATIYSDISQILNQYAPGKKVLDVGCGTGDLVSYLTDNDFDVVGIEPSLVAVEIAKNKNITVYNATLEKFVELFLENDMEAFDAVLLINVLEHVPAPGQIMGLIKKLLKPNALLCARVPNEFNELQLAAQKKLDKDQWWIVPPDHINYFDFRTLSALLKGFEFDIVYSQSDFPMEFFLLMGEDYVRNPEVGGKCHQRRISFETSIPGELRRRIYRALAEVGEGRSCVVFGKLKDE